MCGTLYFGAQLLNKSMDPIAWSAISVEKTSCLGVSKSALDGSGLENNSIEEKVKKKTGFFKPTSFCKLWEGS